MKQHTITTYAFNELSEESKQKAIKNNWDVNVNYDWWERVYENAEQIGCKITSFDLNCRSYCNMKFIDSPGEVAENIKSKHGKSCKTFKTAVKYLDDYSKLTTEQEGFEEDSDEFREIGEEIKELDNEFKELVEKEYRIMLTEEYKYLTSEKAIIERIEANEYEFLKNGKLYC